MIMYSALNNLFTHHPLSLVNECVYTKFLSLLCRIHFFTENDVHYNCIVAVQLAKLFDSGVTTESDVLF